MPPNPTKKAINPIAIIIAGLGFGSVLIEPT